MTINIEDLKRDREAGTDGSWEIVSYNCPADQSDVLYAKEHGKSLKVGDTLWSVPISIGPVAIDNNHWAGDYLTVDEPDARRIARLPDLEAAFLEAVEALEDVCDYADIAGVRVARAFLERNT